MAKITFDEQEDDCWTCTSFQVRPGVPPIRLTLTSDKEPAQPYIDAALRVLEDLDGLVLKASERILENYSYEHFKGLGVDESLLLKDESPEAMSKVVQLQSAWFVDSDCEQMEMSFSVPWDEHHSYDVEFEEGEALTCAVNG